MTQIPQELLNKMIERLPPQQMDGALLGYNMARLDCISCLPAVVEEVRREVIETIKSYSFYDWSGEQAIYNQVEEIIDRINSTLSLQSNSEDTKNI